MAKASAEAIPDPDEQVTYTLRVPRSLMNALQTFCDDQAFPPDKRAVIHGLLESYLTARGYYKGRLIPSPGAEQLAKGG